MLRKIILKRFSDNNKIEEAKRKAMEMYEKIRNEQKISVNKKLEQEILDKEKSENLNKKIDMSDYNSDRTKKKIEEILDKFEFIDENKKNHKNKFGNIKMEGINLNYYNKIDGDTLLFKLNEMYKNNIDKDKWVKIYEARFDPNYEKFIKFLMNFLKIIIGYKTIFYFKKLIWGAKEKNEKVKTNNDKDQDNLNSIEISNFNNFSNKDIILMIIFYSTTLGFYFFNKGFAERTVAKILVKNDKVRVFTQNYNKTKQNLIFKEIQIEKLKSITSKSKNLHEILYIENNNKPGQLFAYKNGLYDKNFLINLCNPKVKKVEFTNINLE